MKTFSEFVVEATTMPTWGEMNKTPQQRQADAQRRATEKKASQAHVMPTFAELAKKRHAGMSEEEIVEFLSKLFGPKKKATGFQPLKKAKDKDSAHYRTDHHYGHGDIDPKDIPVFKPTWQTAGKS